jgi:hypothetical protein
MAETRICRECKHASNYLPNAGYICSHPELQVIDVVTGYTQYINCYAARLPVDGQCGQKGKLWEPK